MSGCDGTEVPDFAGTPVILSDRAGGLALPLLQEWQVNSRQNTSFKWKMPLE